MASSRAQGASLVPARCAGAVDVRFLQRRGRSSLYERLVGRHGPQVAYWYWGAGDVTMAWWQYVASDRRRSRPSSCP